MDNDQSSESNVRSISPEQAGRLVRVHLEISVAAESDPLAFVVRRLETILDTKVVALTQNRGIWSTRAEATSGPPSFPTSISFPGLDLNLVQTDLATTESWVYQNVEWTLVWFLGADSRPIVFALLGAWTFSTTSLHSLAQSVSLALAALYMARRAHQRLIGHHMSRLLATASGLPEVGDIIIRHMARAVRARLGALAVPETPGRRLAIVASFGYPLALVEQLRIDPGEGVLGEVFERARTIHAPPGRPPVNRQRPRYRTDSFVAVPILGRHSVVGVASVTDRIDDKAFTREDVAALRALAAPAALALERERAVTDAEAYARAAAIDPVSGVFNRRYFHVRLDEELQRSRRHNMPVALLMIDIDDFKAINDAFGHLAGDTIIKEVADILRRSVRVFDVCSRFGGEEFAIVMPGSGTDSALKIAERIRERIESYRPQDSMLAKSRITVSIGLATSSAMMGARELVERADRALYVAKRSGKNQVRTIGPDEMVRPLAREL